tara:strand:+ start:100 stop:492 length:393 start_codon:yes stop_codon:yes gene_type:complete
MNSTTKKRKIILDKCNNSSINIISKLNDLSISDNNTDDICDKKRRKRRKRWYKIYKKIRYNLYLSYIKYISTFYIKFKQNNTIIKYNKKSTKRWLKLYKKIRFRIYIFYSRYMAGYYRDYFEQTYNIILH